MISNFGKINVKNLKFKDRTQRLSEYYLELINANIVTWVQYIFPDYYQNVLELLFLNIPSQDLTNLLI